VALIAPWLREAKQVLLAFDAPLGWPQALGTALYQHRAGGSLPPQADPLFRRATDQWVKRHLGKQPLEVGANLIARTAHAALRILQELREHTQRPFPLAWEPTLPEWGAAIEVYPAATLIAHGFPSQGYKTKNDRAVREDIAQHLERVLTLPAQRTALIDRADALDAVVCILAGYDFLRGLAYPPDDLPTAQHEGWIWFRRPKITP
jgi:predicted RNase H-like nuclease